MVTGEGDGEHDDCFVKNGLCQYRIAVESPCRTINRALRLLINSKEDTVIRILSAQSEVAFFVPDVQSHADTDKDALGFLPASVYEEAAQSQNLLVAVASRGDLNIYAGHLLFGGKFPRAKIYQTFVLPEFRRRKVGRALVDKLVSITEASNYLSLSAKVAADLPANGFYEAMGFEVVAVRPRRPLPKTQFERSSKAVKYANPLQSDRG